MAKKHKPSSRITEQDYIKAMRKASRELELELHGRQISLRPRVLHKSKKAYCRKGNKKETD